ncbi:MAG: tripartite tricarboxylate transporter TctB family protein [Gallionella sp.]
MHDNDHSEDRRQHGASTKPVEIDRRRHGVYSERRQHHVPVKVDRRRHGVSAKAVEIAVAAVMFGLGLVVIFDSRRVGYGWADDGPQAGYFPFYIGLILCAASAWTLLRAAFSSRAAGGVFVSRRKLRLVLSVFFPSLIYVIAIYFIGIYVASALFIGAFMYWHGRFPWIKIIPVSLIVPVSMFLLFELWFLVPLPKGPLEALAGY